jgi:hypothetical protein
MSDPYSIRPDFPPPRRPSVEEEPVQLDPFVRDERAGPYLMTGAAIAVVAIVMLALFGVTREPPQSVGQQTAGTPAHQTSSAPTGTGTTDKGSITPPPPASNPSANPPATTGQVRPLPQEQDPVEQNTRP